MSLVMAKSKGQWFASRALSTLHTFGAEENMTSKSPDTLRFHIVDAETAQSVDDNLGGRENNICE